MLRQLTNLNLKERDILNIDKIHKRQKYLRNVLIQIKVVDVLQYQQIILTQPDQKRYHIFGIQSSKLLVRFVHFQPLIKEFSIFVPINRPFTLVKLCEACVLRK